MTTRAELLAEFAANVRAARKRRGLTQAEVARRVGHSRASLANIEAGRQDAPMVTLLRLCGVLGTTPTQLLPKVLRKEGNG